MTLLLTGLLVYGSLLPWSFDIAGYVAASGGSWQSVFSWVTSPRWIPAATNVSSYGVPVWISDLVLNLLLYGPLGVLLRLTASRITGRQWAQIALSVMAVVALSWLIESTQSLIPGRYASIQDVLNNSFGGAVGVLLGHRMNSLWRWSAFVFYRRTAGPRYAINHYLSKQRSRPTVMFGVLIINAMCIGLWYWVTSQPSDGSAAVSLVPFAEHFSRSYDVAAVLVSRSMVVYCLLGGLLMVMMMRGRTRAALGWVVLLVALMAAGVEVMKLLSVEGGSADVTEPLLAMMAGGFVLTLGFMLMHACRCSCRRRVQMPVATERRQREHDYRFAIASDNPGRYKA